MKHFFKVVLIVIFSFLIGCQQQDRVQLIGSVNFQHEANTEYVDPGVNVPEGYSVIVNGNVNKSLLGTYNIEYSVINEEGETVKTLFRIVNVVDTTPPSVSLNENFEFQYGVHTESNLVHEIEDNYYHFSHLEISSDIDIVNPNRIAGQFEITFRVVDPSGNIQIASTMVDFKPFNIYEFFDYLRQNKPSSIHSITKGAHLNGSVFLNVITSNRYSMLINEDGRVDFYYQIVTSYGNGSLIIRGFYGNLDNSNVSIHISSGVANYTYADVNGYNILAETLQMDYMLSPDMVNFLNIPHSQVKSIFNTNITAAAQAMKETFEDILRIKLR